MLVADAHARTEIQITPQLLRRFWDKVELRDECWEWRGATRVGYGAIKIAGRVWETHRVSWLLHHGELPEAKYVCHHCDNRRCVRPDHLFLGTQQDNVDDMLRKGRHNFGKGEAMPNAVLSDAVVLQIWKMRSATGWGSRRIGRELGVSNDAVEKVLAGASWAHVRPQQEQERGMCQKPPA
ncbi:hypothetical protein LCGC14_1258810 [marine sediment metagenome]|uniref:HNH nuclease domain-containing protein n=1 Tax=marine sediment metagenome TaxID=412755 RepID=A0A0F9LMN2_9ZZZZ